ncbi:PIN domain nuclease [Nanoarchaeota archaeon]
MISILDTNVIFSYLVKNDTNHKKAVEIINKYDKIIMTTVTILELTYILKKSNIDLSIIKDLLYSEEVEFVDNSIEDIIFSINNKPKSYDEFNDYIILHTALRLNTNLETFDEELLKEYKKHK